MTSILSAFNISNLTNAEGEVIEAKIEFGDGLNRYDNYSATSNLHAYLPDT